MTIGGKAKATSATSAAFGMPHQVLIPQIWAPNTKIAKLGTARPTLLTLMASHPKRRLWPSHRAIGRPTTMAMATATSDILRCSYNRFGMPVSPDQRLEVVNHPHT